MRAWRGSIGSGASAMVRWRDRESRGDFVWSELDCGLRMVLLGNRICTLVLMLSPLLAIQV